MNYDTWKAHNPADDEPGDKPPTEAELLLDEIAESTAKAFDAGHEEGIRLAVHWLRNYAMIEIKNGRDQGLLLNHARYLAEAFGVAERRDE